LHQLTDEELSSIHPELKPDVRDVLTVHGALASRTTRGGTAPSALAQQLKDAQGLLEDSKKRFSAAGKEFSTMMGASH
jgi:argininosuccinate lyase